jgi:hypothetical protein
MPFEHGKDVKSTIVELGGNSMDRLDRIMDSFDLDALPR